MSLKCIYFNLFWVVQCSLQLFPFTNCVLYVGLLIEFPESSLQGRETLIITQLYVVPNSLHGPCSVTLTAASEQSRCANKDVNDSIFGTHPDPLHFLFWEYAAIQNQPLKRLHLPLLETHFQSLLITDCSFNNHTEIPNFLGVVTFITIIIHTHVVHVYVLC